VTGGGRPRLRQRRQQWDITQEEEQQQQRQPSQLVTLAQAPSSYHHY